MAADSAGRRGMPLWLLDVDGVLNAVALVPDPGVWPQWRRGVAGTDGGTRTWPITWAPAVIEELTRWMAQGRVEVAWLTTWAHDANGELGALLGMPQLPVAGTPPSRVNTAAADPAGIPPRAHAEVAGADAVDPLTGHWWKFDAVRRLLAGAPDRALIWTDDDLAAEPEVVAWMEEHTASLLIAPDPRVGLTPEDLRAVDGFLDAGTGRG